jgi:hypothetical protein
MTTNESNNEITASESKKVGEEGQVLAAGVDTLHLAVDVYWRNDQFFKTLTTLKAEAVAKRCQIPYLLKSEGFEWAFGVTRSGIDGYEWFLKSAEYEVKIGNWMSPKSRPSILIEIRSQTLWLYGVVEAIDRILTLLNRAGAIVKETKASRIDMCVDLLVPESLWNQGLAKHRVCRAKKLGKYELGEDCTGFVIGQGGAFSARLYDKPLEIKQKSKKYWLYDVWKIQEVPDGCRVIRVEFQLRRQAIVELGMNSVWSFTNHPRNAWAYCTQVWLKFQDRPELHHSQQNMMPFWKSVQDGFFESQGEQPMLRAKMVNVKEKQIAQQLIGQLTSLIALNSDEFAPELEIEQQLPLVLKSAKLVGMDDETLSERVRRKQGKYIKAAEHFEKTEIQRKQLGLPQRTPHEGGVA